jgi:hypothetical protein
MRASFERGEASAPRGHALLFFRETVDPERIRASYLVIAPIEMDFAKYVPPMFAAQLSGLMPSGPAALPLPPIPEPVDSLAWLERLAAARHDDLLDGGRVDPANPQQMMLTTTELAAEYAALWTEHARRLADLPTEISQPAEPVALQDVEDLLLSVTSDAEKVGRLAKLAGTIRYAVEVRDEHLAGDTLAEMQRIGRHLPDSYRLSELLAAARLEGASGARLLELYLDRCYKLAAEQYAELEQIDRKIDELTKQQHT